MVRSTKHRTRMHIVAEAYEGGKNFPGKPMVGTFSTPHELSEKSNFKIKTRDLSEKRTKTREVYLIKFLF